MLGLAEQVGGDDHRVGRLVGDDEDLGRAGDEVDADLPEQPALRLDDVRVARPDEEVDRVDRLRPERQRGERLDAAEDVDLVGAGEVHGGDVASGTRPSSGGVHAATRSTPATFAVTMLMCADATIG